MWIGLSVFAISSSGSTVSASVRMRSGCAQLARLRADAACRRCRSGRSGCWFWSTCARSAVMVIGGCSARQALHDRLVDVRGVVGRAVGQALARDHVARLAGLRHAHEAEVVDDVVRLVAHVDVRSACVVAAASPAPARSCRRRRTRRPASAPAGASGARCACCVVVRHGCASVSRNTAPAPVRRCPGRASPCRTLRARRRGRPDSSSRSGRGAALPDGRSAP